MSRPTQSQSHPRVQSREPGQQCHPINTANLVASKLDPPGNAAVPLSVLQLPAAQPTHRPLVTNLPVNPALVGRVSEMLIHMGVADPQEEIRRWSEKMFHTIALFAQACASSGLNSSWGSAQTAAFLDLLHKNYYSVSTLDAYWKAFLKVGKILGKTVLAKEQNDFTLVREESKELQDNKLPVSSELLRQLLVGADAVLQEYNAALAKALFICAWAFSMRLSEYSLTKATGKARSHTHNLREGAICTSGHGLSAQFTLDKTSRFAWAIKHCTIRWTHLPNGSRIAVESYIAQRPAGTPFFFCHREGCPLTRSSVLGLLDVCLLQTDYIFINITPHSFRLGRASEAALARGDIPTIMHKGRWAPSSLAFEAYSLSDLMALESNEIHARYPKYRRQWKTNCLHFLSQTVVETVGRAAFHPHEQVLRQAFPQAHLTIREWLPAAYPHPMAEAKIWDETANRTEKTYLKAIHAENIKEAKKQEQNSNLLNNLQTDAAIQVQSCKTRECALQHSGYRERNTVSVSPDTTCGARS